MVAAIIRKDPTEIRKEPMDWTLGLNEGAIVATSTWEFPTGLTKDSEGLVVGALKTYVVMSGGTHGQDYVVTNHITTSDGERLDQSGRVRVRNSEAP